MKYLIDTNIILDVMLKRPAFVEGSSAVLYLCENKTILGFVTASAITDIYYILRKALKDREQAYKYLGHVLEIVSVLPVVPEDITDAYLLKAQDFEDALIYVCAERNGLNGIVTRDKKDFAEFDIKTFSPEVLNSYMLNEA
ncbi:MAG: PIN domain-containing protein [Clostridiales bacterium]|nr:PIN domain-containing protein [Clostridiales bacterium]